MLPLNAVKGARLFALSFLYSLISLFSQQCLKLACSREPPTLKSRICVHLFTGHPGHDRKGVQNYPSVFLVAVCSARRNRLGKFKSKTHEKWRRSQEPGAVLYRVALEGKMPSEKGKLKHLQSFSNPQLCHRACPDVSLWTKLSLIKM